MEASSAISQPEKWPSLKLQTTNVPKKHFVTIGCESHVIDQILKSGSHQEDAFDDLLHYIKDYSRKKPNRTIDAVFCSYTLSDIAIRRLVKFMHNANDLLSVPIIMVANRVDIKSKQEILDLGLDDIVDGSIDEDLFYERVEILQRTKRNLLENPEDHLILRMANIDIKINFFKRAGDILISFLMLLFLSPLFLIVATLIKIESRGPIFYISKRAGAGYKVFNFYKFRSMAQNAELKINSVTHLNQYNQGESDKKSVFYKIKSDPRVTKIGAFLRKTSIDELPQLLNVLKGDMSLVGNRPLPLYEAQQLTRDNWVARFNAPAGITGLWQISKRGKADMSEEERMELDVEYSRNHSFWYDMWILVSTIPVIFQEDNV